MVNSLDQIYNIAQIHNNVLWNLQYYEKYSHIQYEYGESSA